MELHLTTLSKKIEIKHVSELQSIDKMGKKHFFTPFSNGNTYSGRNFALLEFRKMQNLEPKIPRNSRNLLTIENASFWVTNQNKICQIVSLSATHN